MNRDKNCAYGSCDLFYRFCTTQTISMGERMIIGGLYDMNTGILIDSRNAKNDQGVPVLPSPYELESHICLIGETLPESVVVTRGSKVVEATDQDGNPVSSTIETILLNGVEYQKGTCTRADMFPPLPAEEVIV